MKRRLWFNTWSEEYIEGLPIGNGRLAAMMTGRPEKLRIALNHEWLWRGVNRFREQEDVSEHLPEVREALLSGDFLKGTRLANTYFAGAGGFTGKPSRNDPYQPAGDVWIELDAGKATEYKRSLNMDTGLAETCFKAPSGLITEQFFASCTDDCIIGNIKSEQPCDMHISMSRIEDAHCILSFEACEDGLLMKGAFIKGIDFDVCVRIQTDGTYTVEGNRIAVANATDLFLMIQIGTNAKGNATSYEMTYPDERCFTTLFERHKERFMTLSGDSVLDIDVEDGDDMPTDERIRLFREGKEPSMPLLYFEYGRYLMVSGSTAELPLNLQGKWNDNPNPSWDCDYHLDINLQMCYWFVETLGMKYSANTLFNLIERYVPYGRVVARNLYGCKGFTLCIQTDVWGRVTPEAYGWGVWIGSAPWLGQHMFMHWRHTKDLDFLKNRCYPYLKEAAAFYEDYLIERNGELWVVPSQSPENAFEGTGNFDEAYEYAINNLPHDEFLKYITSGDFWPVSIGYNSAMDIELITELLNSAAESADILGVDADKAAQWREMVTRLPKLGTDSIGRLNEWDKERVEMEPGHRHLSHLYGLYPSQLFEPGSREWIAAEKSLDERMSHGGGHTGWSRSWAACMMARLGRGEDAWHHFMELIGEFATVSLLDLHPPRIFQIDGNMGGTACVCEMLMQSRRGELRLLPALPKAWPKGHVENFYAQDGVKVSFAWDNGKLTGYTLLSAEDQTLKVISGDQEWIINLKADVPYTACKYCK